MDEPGPPLIALRPVTLARHATAMLVLGTYSEEPSWDSIDSASIADFLDEVLEVRIEFRDRISQREAAKDVWDSWTSAVRREIASATAGIDAIERELAHCASSSADSCSIWVMAASLGIAEWYSVRDLPLREALFIVQGNALVNDLRATLQED